LGVHKLFMKVGIALCVGPLIGTTLCRSLKSKKESLMDKSLRVTLIANAGLLLEYNGTKMLLDGIYGSEGHPFSNLSPQLWQQMKEGKPPFDQVDVLLFTHAHPDHFSPEMTLEYLQHRSVKGVFVPDTRTVAESGLASFLQEQGTPCALLSEQTDRTGFRVTADITVRAFRTRHLDKKFEKVRHFCYLITFGDKNVLFTADIDYVTEDLNRLEGVRLAAAFVNPLFFSVLCHGRFFKGRLEAENLVVYHLPFAEDDTMTMRAGVERSLARWPEAGAKVTVLQEPFQQVCFQ